MTLDQSVCLVCGHITPGKLSSPSEVVVDLLPEHLLVSGVFQFNFYQATAGLIWCSQPLQQYIWHVLACIVDSMVYMGAVNHSN